MEQAGWTTTGPSASKQLLIQLSVGIHCYQGCRHPLSSARGTDRRPPSAYSATESTTYGTSVLSPICTPQPHEVHLAPMLLHEVHTLLVPDANQKMSASRGIKAPVSTQVTVTTCTCVPLVHKARDCPRTQDNSPFKQTPRGPPLHRSLRKPKAHPTPDDGKHAASHYRPHESRQC